MIVASLMITVLIPAAAFAGSNKDVNSGKSGMVSIPFSSNNLIKPMATQNTQYVGGGTWNYGVTDGLIIYSYFYQPTLTHKSSVYNNQWWTISPWTAPGETSTASEPEGLDSPGSAYWSNQ